MYFSSRIAEPKIRPSYLVNIQGLEGDCQHPCRCYPSGLRGLPLEQETAHSEAQLADTIKIVSLIQRFRSKGHLTAQLDPLKRVAYGPWMADIGISSPWCALSCLSAHGSLRLSSAFAKQLAYHSRFLWPEQLRVMLLRFMQG